jgi:hypothetical protein
VKGYRLYNIVAWRLLFSHDVIFDEQAMVLLMDYQDHTYYFENDFIPIPN